MGESKTLLARKKDGAEFPVEISLSPISSDRGTFVAASVRDITERLATQRQLQLQLQMEGLVSIVTMNVNAAMAEVLENRIDEVVATVGQSVDVDICYVRLGEETAQELVVKHEWVRIPELHAGTNPRSVPRNTHGWIEDRIEEHQPFHFSCLDDLPPEAAQTRVSLETQDVRSLLVAPLTAGSTLLGIVGMKTIGREHAWTASDVHLAQVIGNIVGAALLRQEQR